MLELKKSPGKTVDNFPRKVEKEDIRHALEKQFEERIKDLQKLQVQL